MIRALKGEPGSVSMWEPTVLLPAQVARGRAINRCPEIRLVAAVLEEALLSITRNVAARSGARQREFFEACKWFADDSRDWPFAFANVCDLLGLDAMAVRSRVARLVSARRGVVEVSLRPRLLRVRHR